MALGDVIARLAVSLSLDSSSFTKGSKGAQKEAETLGKNMKRIAGVIGTAFVASIGVDTVRAWADATKGALEFAGSLGETAQQVGATTDELQEFRYVASQVGIEQATMDKGLAKISVTLGELAAGVGGTAKKLEAFGFTQAEIARISKLSAGDALQFLAGKYAALESPTEKAALAAAFFGSRMGGQFIPLLNEGAAALQKMRDAAHELGIVISQSAIDNADKNADLVATYEQIAEAQKNAALLVPENVKAYIEYRKTVDDLQISLYKLAPRIAEVSKAFQGWVDAFDAFNAKHRGATADLLNSTNVSLSGIAWAFKTTTGAVVDAVKAMVDGIKHWAGAALTAVWDGVKVQIRAVADSFNWLYDAVIGHSYIPDLVTGVGAWMAKLDAVMVKPVTAATTKAEEAFRDMASEVRGILDRLFPETAARLQYERERAALIAGGAPASALHALTNEREVARQNAMPGIDFGDKGGPLTEGMGDVGDAIERLTEKAKIGTVQIAKSFGDMALDVANSLQGLARAIKGGGFWDILNSVITTGLQLGQSGVLGGNVASFLNRVPGHAAGTSSTAPGLAWVGERGPELVNFRGGERVHSSRDSMKMAGGTLDIRPSPLFEVYLNGKLVEATPGIVAASSASTLTRLSRRNAKALA